MEALFKAYVYKNMLSDLTKLLRKAARQVDFDADAWLRRVGLTRYRPIRMTAGGAALLLLGAGVGVAIGLALAPKPGTQFRADVKEKARDVLDSVSRLAGTTEAAPPKPAGRARA